MEPRYLECMVIFTMAFMFSSLVSGDSLMGGHLDNQKVHPDASNSSMRYRVVNVVPFAFNGGQPFSLEKDPVTGQIDFDKAPPLTALNYTGSYGEDNDRQTENEEENRTDEDEDNDTKPEVTVSLDEGINDEDQRPNEINPYSPSFHDFLNLPVRYSNHEKYTSDKYPLISSSYANTKVQGGSGHKGYIINYNHYSGGKASTSQSYSMTRNPFVPKSTTKRTTTTMSTTTTTMRTTMRTTTEPPTITTMATPRTTPSTQPTTETTTVKITSWKPPKMDKIDRYDVDYEGEGILPIEKMQATDNREDLEHHAPLNPIINEYDDSYDEFIVVESTPIPMQPVSITTTTTTTPKPTTSAPTSTSPKISVSLNTDMKNSENTIDKSSINPQEEVNGHSNGHTNINSNLQENSYHIPPPNSPMNQPYSGIAVESSSNVIVPPDQDTMSFVLGNRQNVQGSYYTHGSAVPESPYSDGSIRPIGLPEPVPHVHEHLPVHEHLSVQDVSDHIPVQHILDHLPVQHVHDQLPVQHIQENLPVQHLHEHLQHQHVHENLPHQPNPDLAQALPGLSADRFGLPPIHEQEPNWWFGESQDKMHNIPNIPEKVKDDKINVVAGYRVVFPTEPSVPYHSSILPSTTVASSTMDSSPTISDVLTPPAKNGPMPSRPMPPGQRPPPGYYPPHHHYHQRPSEIPPRIQRPPLPSTGNGYKIRPPIDINLPNILPQFRPNVKTSQRRGSEVIGTMIIPSSPKYPTRVSIRPPPAPIGPPPPAHHRGPLRRPPVLSHLQRLHPPPPPVHSLRLPTPAALIAPEPHVQAVDNIPIHMEVFPHRRTGVNTDGKLQYDIDERNNRLGTITNQLKSRLNDEDLEKLSAETPAMPPKTPLFPKRKNGNSSVATLQMIQQHGVQPEGEADKNNENENEKVNENKEADRRVDESPVYVVYPVKGPVDAPTEPSNEEKRHDNSVVVGIHGPQRPLPPETLPQENEEPEEIPSSPPVRLASDFPYPLEKPDASLFISQGQETPLLVPDESDQQEAGPYGEKLYLNSEDHPEKDTNVNIIPYLQDHQPFAIKANAISATLQLYPGSSSSTSSSVTPIAYVYTPTMRTPFRRPDVYERNPVSLHMQQPSNPLSPLSSVPIIEGFKPPFIASLSAESSSVNGWSVVTGGPYLSKSIAADRIDRNEDESSKDDETSTIERTTTDTNTDNKENGDELQLNQNEFDTENFKPQLYGGFQPIFQFPSDSEEIRSDAKEIDATMIEKPRIGRKLT